MSAWTSEQIAARLLHRDGLCLIIDKPAGLPVHAGPKGGANLEQLLDGLTFGLPKPPHLAHRLDRDTSGCLVLGRHAKALRRLGQLFSSGAVAKTYWAVAIGRPERDAGTIDLALAKRSTQARGWWMQPDPAGQQAVTDWKLLGEADGLSWLELHPRTGRTHQIRVHLEALGCPVLGDPVYGHDLQPSPRPPLHLLSRAVSFSFGPGRTPIAARAAPPPHMTEALAQCGWRSDPTPEEP